MNKTFIHTMQKEVVVSKRKMLHYKTSHKQHHLRQQHRGGGGTTHRCKHCGAAKNGGGGGGGSRRKIAFFDPAASRIVNVAHAKLETHRAPEMADRKRAFTQRIKERHGPKNSNGLWRWVHDELMQGQPRAATLNKFPRQRPHIVSHHGNIPREDIGILRDAPFHHIVLWVERPTHPRSQRHGRLGARMDPSICFLCRNNIPRKTNDAGLHGRSGTTAHTRCPSGTRKSWCGASFPRATSAMRGHATTAMTSRGRKGFVRHSS